MNAAKIYFTAVGKNNKLTHIPATSSITILLLSFPQSFSNLPDDQIPIPVIEIVAAISNIWLQPFLQIKYQHMQTAIAAIVPPPFM